MPILFAAAAVVLCAAPQPSGVVAFEELKKLEGNWVSEDAAAPAYVSYRVVHGGTAVLETVSGADRSKLLSAAIYHLDGDELQVEVYAGAGDAPRLKVKAASNGALRFEGQAANKGAQPASLTLTRTGPAQLSREWTVGKTAAKATRFKREYVDELK